MFYISDDEQKMAPESVKLLIEQTYWASKRPLDVIAKSIENSVCFGAFDSQSDELIGFARVVSDFCTCFYLCDVIVDERHRAGGVGKALISAITSDKRFDGLEGLLITRDAHGLYSQYGFESKEEIFMGRGLNSSL
ncbi:MAG: GNAT family N-acetyltransferase [Oscillospiraceae bacterium]|nr:GNAT family N-acetyltransferase [Candidatus Equicaccousia limihippi]